MKKSKIYVLWNEFGESICIDGHDCTKEEIIKELKLIKEELPNGKFMRLYITEIENKKEGQFLSHITKDKTYPSITVWFYGESGILDIDYALKQDGSVFYPKQRELRKL